MIEKIAKASADVASENLEKLRTAFPQFVKDGEVDFDALKAFFEAKGVLAGTEKYGLNWAGKSNAFKAIRASATGTLTPQEKASQDFEKTKNIFIEGDNLEVLKLLQKKYREQIKMIYIDPPYNTGKDFIYTDNFTENKSDYYERTGQSENGIRLTSNPESNGRYHSDWLTMMYPRLFMARNLLRNDGVIFVSIDDNEVANLRMIMDEIFGEENFVANFIWRRSGAGGLRGDFVIENHEYVLCYIKNILDQERWYAPYSESSEEQFKYHDENGQYKTQALYLTSLKQTLAQSYFIALPNGTLAKPPEGVGSWRFIENTYKEWFETGLIIFKRTKNSPLVLKNGEKAEYNIYTKQYQEKNGSNPSTWLAEDVIGQTRSAKALIKDLFGDTSVFDYAKPLALIKFLMKMIGIKNDDIILDFFAGSGTTAHAVMDLNAEDGGNRKWICVQIPEETDEESEAYKAGYKTIAEISRERIRRAGAKIGKGDIGFKAFSLSKSNHTQWNVLTDQDDEEALKKQAKLFIDQPLVAGYDERSVVYEILIKEGFDLNAKVTREKGDLQPWIVADGDKKLIVTFAEKVTKDQVENLKLSEQDTFICFDSALDDTTKVNIARNSNVKVI